MDDLISRQQAIDAAIEAADDWDGRCSIGRQKRIENYIKRLPAAEPRGKWTADNACSECGCQPWFSRDIHIYNFCPNCGADMREETE